MSSHEQTTIEDQALQTIWSIQEQLKTLTDLIDRHHATLQAGESFLLAAFSGWPILDACQAVDDLEQELIDAKFEKVGEAAYFPQEIAATT